MSISNYFLSVLNDGNYRLNNWQLFFVLVSFFVSVSSFLYIFVVGHAC